MNVPESQDGTGAADNDTPYTFGQPISLYVDPRSEARLAVLRARIGENARPYWTREENALHRENAA